MPSGRCKGLCLGRGLAGCVALLALIWGLSLWAIPAHDPDLGWHLLGGSLILDTGVVPRGDIINSFRLEWHDYHWLAQIPLAWLYRLGGYESLRVALGIWMGLLFVALVWLGARSKYGSMGGYSALMLTAAFFLIREIVTVRPQLIALLGLILALGVLVRRRTKGEIPILFGLACLGANIHVYWVFIPYLWFLYRVAPRLTQKRAPGPLYAWGGLFLLGAAGLFSPYGLFSPTRSVASIVSNYALIWDYVTMPEVLKGSINELRSTLASTNGVQVILLLYVVVVARTSRWRRFLADLGSGLAMLTGLVLAVLGIKYVAVCAIFCLPYLLRHPLPLFVGRPQFVSVGRAFLLAGIAFFGYRAVVSYPPRNPNDHLIDTFVPYTGCGKLAELVIPGHRDVDEIRILTHFNHGGWCRWALYEKAPQRNYRVTTDNRTQGVPGEHYRRSFDLFGVKGEWLKTLAEWNPDIAVVQKAYPLAQFMGLSPDRWRKVYEDGEFAIFQPLSPTG